MPIYEYACQDCGKQCEVIQKVTDEPISICPYCGGQLHKLISQTSFILKGTGWYVTDYASPERKKALEFDRPADAKIEGKAETKTVTDASSAAKN